VVPANRKTAIWKHLFSDVKAGVVEAEVLLVAAAAAAAAAIPK
jgi:hypothetical protein